MARCRAIPRCRQTARKLVLPHSKLEGEANILIMPNLDTANVAYQMIKALADALAGRADPDRPGAAGAYPYPVGDRARHSQHDGGCRGRGPGARRPSAADSVRLDRQIKTGSGRGSRFDRLKSESETTIIACATLVAFAIRVRTIHASVHYFRAGSVRRALYLHGRDQAVRHPADRRLHRLEGRRSPRCSRPTPRSSKTMTRNDDAANAGDRGRRLSRSSPG